MMSESSSGGEELSMEEAMADLEQVLAETQGHAPWKVFLAHVQQDIRCALAVVPQSSSTLHQSILPVQLMGKRLPCSFVLNARERVQRHTVMISCHVCEHSLWMRPGSLPVW